MYCVFIILSVSSLTTQNVKKDFWGNLGRFGTVTNVFRDVFWGGGEKSYSDPLALAKQSSLRVGVN